MSLATEFFFVTLSSYDLIDPSVSLGRFATCGVHQSDILSYTRTLQEIRNLP
jgi:hypothetical protein